MVPSFFVSWETYLNLLMLANVESPELRQGCATRTNLLLMRVMDALVSNSAINSVTGRERDVQWAI